MHLVYFTLYASNVSGFPPAAAALSAALTKGFASMILDQAICCLADLGFFSTALQVAKPPHTGKILRASTFSKLIHRTWERWHKRTMP